MGIRTHNFVKVAFWNVFVLLLMGLIVAFFLCLLIVILVCRYLVKGLKKGPFFYYSYNFQGLLMQRRCTVSSPLPLEGALRWGGKTSNGKNKYCSNNFTTFPPQLLGAFAASSESQMIIRRRGKCHDKSKLCNYTLEELQAIKRKQKCPYMYPSIGMLPGMRKLPGRNEMIQEY